MEPAGSRPVNCPIIPAPAFGLGVPLTEPYTRQAEVDSVFGIDGSFAPALPARRISHRVWSTSPVKR